MANSSRVPHAQDFGWRYSLFHYWNRFNIRCLLIPIVLAIGCSTRENTDERTGTSRSAISGSCADGPVLGFESTSNWTASSGKLSLSTTHTQGSFALAVNNPVNYTTIVSSPLSSSDPALASIDVGSVFEIDLMLPTVQPNPSWFGAMQMYINSPSRAVYNQFLGEIELTGLALGVFLTESFAIPSAVATALHGQSYSDLTLTVVLNVPFAGTGVYLLDNLRLKGTTTDTGNVHPNVICVNNKGSGRFEALFGYSNENSDITNLPIGTSNQFSPGPAGRGQIEDFLHITSPAAFSVVFDGTPLTWMLSGGCATASSSTPACPTTACTPACRTGQQCVGGQCVTECGDGLCAGDESCNTCPSDCACAAGQTCVLNTCATPVQCGIGWQCGSGTSFGVNVDCGACPNGGTCINHLCQ